MKSTAAFLDSVQGEISFFRSLMRARPVGIHRYFHVLAIRNSIHADTGRFVNPEDIWAKLRTCYDLDALESIDLEAEGYHSPGSNNSTPTSIPSPSPDENLACHPFFREEFALPYDEFEPLISVRRMRATASTPSSSPAPSPPPLPPAPPPTKTRKETKRGKSTIVMAGLVGGDSDSSALTQESGDEGVPSTPRESAATGTDGGTEYGENEDVDMRDVSPVLSVTSKPGRKPKAGKKAPGTAGRPRGGAAGASGRLGKKRKR